MKIKGIVFDMDGTLFDTERVSLKGCKRANKDFGIEFSEDVFVGFMGLPSREIERKYLEMFGQDFDYATYRELKIKYMNEEIEEKGVPCKEGLFELLDYAKANNISCAVATSTSRWRAEELIKKAEVEKYFDAIICGEDVKNGKPNPDIFCYAAEKIGLSPEDCIGIEDSRNGILAVSKSGMYSILIPDLAPVTEEMTAAADLVCNSLKDVLELIKK